MTTWVYIKLFCLCSAARRAGFVRPLVPYKIGTMDITPSFKNYLVHSYLYLTTQVNHGVVTEPWNDAPDYSPAPLLQR